MRATLNEAADRFSGQAITELLDLDVNRTATIAATVDAVRIRVEVPN